MTRVRVAWSERVVEDLLEIVDYIASRSPQNAAGVPGRLEERAAGLDRFPERGRVVPELHDQGITTVRELIARPWRIVYEFDGRAATVVGVFDGRRSLSSVLMQRYLGM